MKDQLFFYLIGLLFGVGLGQALARRYFRPKFMKARRAQNLFHLLNNRVKVLRSKHDSCTDLEEQEMLRNNGRKYLAMMVQIHIAYLSDFDRYITEKKRKKLFLFGRRI